MKIDKELRAASPSRDSVLTIGVFDGVHRGHRHLFARVKAEADKGGYDAGVVTFRDHPDSALRPDFLPRYLTDLDERVRLIEEVGVDFVVPVTFDLPLSRLSASEFLDLLQSRLRMKGLVVGPDFAMGYKRAGDVDALASLGRERGFALEVVEPVLDAGKPITSTAVREALGRGDIARAAVLLGRNFSLGGRVVEGSGRGRTLGFPTANLRIDDSMAVPGDGIYATFAAVGRRRYLAATSVGGRPTFDDAKRTIEAFILDFDEDLYGRAVTLEFVHRLRDVERYETVGALKEQVAKDVERTRTLLTPSTSARAEEAVVD